MVYFFGAGIPMGPDHFSDNFSLAYPGPFRFYSTVYFEYKSGDDREVWQNFPLLLVAVGVILVILAALEWLNLV